MITLTRTRRASPSDSLTPILHDYLETHGPLRMRHLVGLIVERHPGRNEVAIRRAMVRMVARGEVVKIIRGTGDLVPLYRLEGT